MGKAWYAVACDGGNAVDDANQGLSVSGHDGNRSSIGMSGIDAFRA
ncbi:hypothetical protein WJ968_33330 [Achromobacter xylosoxidans]